MRVLENTAGLGSSHLLKNSPNPSHFLISLFPHFLHWFLLPPDHCAQPITLIVWGALGVHSAVYTGTNWDCSKAVQTCAVINSYQCSSTCLLPAFAMLCLLVGDAIFHAMLIARIWGYLRQANCCGITVFMLR